MWPSIPIINVIKELLEYVYCRNIVGVNKMDSCKPHFKALGMLTAYSIYIPESAMFVKNNKN